MNYVWLDVNDIFKYHNLFLIEFRMQDFLNKLNISLHNTHWSKIEVMRSNLLSVHSIQDYILIRGWSADPYLSLSFFMETILVQGSSKKF